MDYAIKSTKYLLSKDDGLLAFSVHSLSAREKVISCNNSIINPHRLAIVLQHYKKLRKTQEDKRTQVEIRQPTAVGTRAVATARAAAVTAPAGNRLELHEKISENYTGT